jgi:hypothetical protein
VTERFPKLSVEQMSPLQREVAAEISAGPRGEVRGPFIPLIHHAGLARNLQRLGEFLRFESVLPPAILELIALSGYDTLMAMVLNTAGMALPDDAAPPLAPL